MTKLLRRTFIHRLLQGSLAPLLLPPLPGNANTVGYTVTSIIDLILKEIAPLPADTIDTLKSGRPQQPVTGIVTTMFPTVAVIEKTIGAGANFIIAHEPVYYHHTDVPDWLPDSRLIARKRQFLEEKDIAVWRCHDAIHAFHPDGIEYGLVKKLDWLSYYTPGQPIVTIPSISLRQLIFHLRKKLELPSVRVIGDPQQPCRRIGILPGAWGGQKQISLLEKEKPDVLLVGEAYEWEIVEYVRDARRWGAPAALVILGHALSEEPGMEWMADRLRTLVQGLPVMHIPSGDPFTNPAFYS